MVDKIMIPTRIFKPMLIKCINTRPKPVEHGYLFSMAVGTIGEWLKLVPFLLGDVQLIQLIQLTP